MAALSLLPFALLMMTCFVKIAVVLSITRQAIGMQQAPPTTVITGMAIILTVYVMQPVGLQIYNRVDKLMQIQRGGDVMAKENVDVIVAPMEFRLPNEMPKLRYEPAWLKELYDGNKKELARFPLK